MKRMLTIASGLAAGLFLLCAAANARADMCFGGGGPPEPPRTDGGAGDGAVGENLKGKRGLGLGLLAVASVGTAWLSLRRRSPGGDA